MKHLLYILAIVLLTLASCNTSLYTTKIYDDAYYYIAHISIIDDDGNIEKCSSDYMLIVPCVNKDLILINKADKSVYTAVEYEGKDIKSINKDIYYGNDIVLRKKERLLDFVYDYGDDNAVILSNDTNNPSDLGDDQKYIAIDTEGIYDVQEIFTVLVPPEEMDEGEIEEHFFKECMETDYDFSGYNPETNCYSYFKIIKEVVSYAETES